MDIVELVYTLTKEIPNEEKFGLVSQTRRCAISLPSNIAEGYGRKSNKEMIRFLSIARGSLNEIETQVIICTRLHLLSIEKTKNIDKLIDELHKMMYAFQKTLITI